MSDIVVTTNRSLDVCTIHIANFDLMLLDNDVVFRVNNGSSGPVPLMDGPIEARLSSSRQTRRARCSAPSALRQVTCTAGASVETGAWG
jgi:hypothetical protein